MIYKCFYKKSSLLADKSGSGGAVKDKIISKQELAEELHKPIIRNFEKRKVYVSFIDNIFGRSCRYPINK